MANHIYHQEIVNHHISKMISVARQRQNSLAVWLYLLILVLVILLMKVSQTYALIIHGRFWITLCLPHK